MTKAKIDDKGYPVCPHCSGELCLADEVPRVYRGFEFDPQAKRLDFAAAANEVLWDACSECVLECSECCRPVELPDGYEYTIE